VHALSVDTITRETSQVVRMLDATLFDALKAQASDLHLESTATGMVIRHRLDGVMVHVGDVGSREVAEQLVSRLDRKSTRRTPVTSGYLVCRLLLEKKQKLTHVSVFFFNDTATTEIYTLSLHDALPIS